MEVECPECPGNGYLPEDGLGEGMECPICNGTGVVEEQD